MATKLKKAPGVSLGVEKLTFYVVVASEKHFMLKRTHRGLVAIDFSFFGVRNLTKVKRRLNYYHTQRSRKYITREIKI